MVRNTLIATTLFALARAQYGPNGAYGPDNNPYSSGDGSSGGYGGDFGAGDYTELIERKKRMVMAHGILACLAFVILFPSGSILMRLGSFPGLWLAHGLFQIFAYIIYIAAAALGLYMATHAPHNIPAQVPINEVNFMLEYHPIIGIVLLVALFIQPFLGYIHHILYAKYNRRTIASYGHLWIGRIAITVGIINGGLGLLLARRTGMGSPPNSAIIAYAVVAAFMWILYVVCAIIGERRRSRNRAAAAAAPPPYKDERQSGSGEAVQYA